MTSQLPQRRVLTKGVGKKFSRGGGQQKKRPKISKKYRKIAPFSLFLGGTDKRPKIAKKAEK